MSPVHFHRLSVLNISVEVVHHSPRLVKKDEVRL